MQRAAKTGARDLDFGLSLQGHRQRDYGGNGERKRSCEQVCVHSIDFRLFQRVANSVFQAANWFARIFKREESGVGTLLDEDSSTAACGVGLYDASYLTSSSFRVSWEKPHGTGSLFFFWALLISVRVTETEVIVSAANGFKIQISQKTDATPRQVYLAMTEGIS